MPAGEHDVTELVAAVAWWRADLPGARTLLADAATAALIAGRDGYDLVQLALIDETANRFDVDELIDYRSRRPTMTFKSDHFSDYDAPELNLYAVKDRTGTPFLLLAGMEPDLRWEKFTTAVRLLAEQLKAEPVGNGLRVRSLSATSLRELALPVE